MNIILKSRNMDQEPPPTSEIKIPLLKALAAVGCLEKVNVSSNFLDFSRLIAFQLNLSMDGVRYVWLYRNRFRTGWKGILTNEERQNVEISWRMRFLHRMSLFNDKEGFISGVPKPFVLAHFFASVPTNAKRQSFTVQTWKEFKEELNSTTTKSYSSISANGHKGRKNQKRSDLWQAEKDLVRFLSEFSQKLGNAVEDGNGKRVPHIPSMAGSRSITSGIIGPWPKVMVFRLPEAELRKHLKKGYSVKQQDENASIGISSSTAVQSENQTEKDDNIANQLSTHGTSQDYVTRKCQHQNNPTEMETDDCATEKHEDHGKLPSSKDNPESTSSHSSDGKAKPKRSKRPFGTRRRKKKKAKSGKKKKETRKRYGKQWADIVRLYGNKNATTTDITKVSSTTNSDTTKSATANIQPVPQTPAVSQPTGVFSEISEISVNECRDPDPIIPLNPDPDPDPIQGIVTASTEIVPEPDIINEVEVTSTITPVLPFPLCALCNGILSQADFDQDQIFSG